MMKGWTLVALLVSGACAFVTKPSLAVVKPTRVLKVRRNYPHQSLFLLLPKIRLLIPSTIQNQVTRGAE